MNVSQTQMRRAILDADSYVPAGLVDEQGRPAGKRFNVYRNNVAASLTEAMQVAFPVVYKLVGDEFFKALAGVFLRQHPPSSPMMMHYGAAFPSFLQKFKPVNHLGYLPDMAKLELALRHSYHAADTPAIDPAALQSLSSEQLMAACLRLAPATRLLRSRWPVHAIWLANTRHDAPKPQMLAEDVLITRVEFDPKPQVLLAGGGHFVEACLHGKSFGAALGIAKAAEAAFNLTATLGLLISGGAIVEIKEG